MSLETNNQARFDPLTHVMTVCQSRYTSFPIFHLWIIKPHSAKKLPPAVLISHLCFSAEGMEAEQKRDKNKQIFWYPAQKKQHPGPDGSNASGSYGRLRGPISSLSVFNSVQPSQQSCHVWHSFTKIDPSSG